MAHPEELTSWLIANSDRLNLRAIEFSWIREWQMDDYRDVEVSLEIEGRTFTGRGTARGESLAFLKAGAEAIERAYCAGHIIHSTGVAAHTKDSEAIENAKHELNERDAFFCHFYTRSSFLLQTIPVDSQNQFSGAHGMAKAKGVEINLYQARSASEPVFIFVATGNNARPRFGAIVGLGSNSDKSKAIESAFLECIRNVAAIIDRGRSSSMKVSDFLKLTKPSSQDRQRLALNPDYWALIEHLFPKEITSQIERSKEIKLEAPSRVAEKITCPFPELIGSPIVVYRVKEQSFKREDILRPDDNSPTTSTRLSRFMGCPVEAEYIETLPHFLG